MRMQNTVGACFMLAVSLGVAGCAAEEDNPFDGAGVPPYPLPGGGDETSEDDGSDETDDEDTGGGDDGDTGGQDPGGGGNTGGDDPGGGAEQDFYAPCPIVGPGMANPSMCPVGTMVCMGDPNGGTWNVCAPPCTTVADCAASSSAATPTCGDGTGGQKICYLDCSGNVACPTGMICRDISGGMGSPLGCVHP